MEKRKSIAASFEVDGWQKRAEKVNVSPACRPRFRQYPKAIDKRTKEAVHGNPGSSTAKSTIWILQPLHSPPNPRAYPHHKHITQSQMKPQKNWSTQSKNRNTKPHILPLCRRGRLESESRLLYLKPKYLDLTETKKTEKGWRVSDVSESVSSCD